MVEANRQLSPKKRKEFLDRHPNKQKLVKTAVAKYDMSWRQFPHLVSKGGETNFVHFTKVINDEFANKEPDQDYFKEMVAKAILFKECDNIVRDLDYPGYKANVVTYSIALLSYLTGQRVDLLQIWQRQDIDEKLREMLTEIAKIVWEHITHPTAAGTNVTQWCKKEECWDLLKERQSLIPTVAEFVATTHEA
ncbi:hypothetical protein CBW65_22555 [Tumebacillus avium]|uniref:Abortive phage infection protein C-terminal domain-containing protein n=1 Tax=Tumebacillus avium TaxID=1903704 RepID=A0A1Y0IU34_9BACL|nr:hypothetical protein CBW65_22555 [Tumebacillus avium]